MTDKDELAKLKARVAELERANKPPEPFVPEELPRYDPTARMSMPVSTMREMANAVPDRMVHDIAMRDNRAPQGPSSQGAIPSSQTVSNVRGISGPLPSLTPGWSEPTPIGPPPNLRWAEAQMIAADARDRAELARKLKP